MIPSPDWHKKILYVYMYVIYGAVVMVFDYHLGDRS